MAAADRNDLHDLRFLVGKYATPSRPARLADLYPGDRQAVISSPAPERSLSEELARVMALLPAEPRPAPSPAPLAEGLSSGQSLGRAAALNRRLQGLSSGQRIRSLRAALGWTQGRAAVELGISRRTLIRHEHGHHRTPSLRLPLELRLRKLETTHAEQIIAHLDRGGANRP